MKRRNFLRHLLIGGASLFIPVPLNIVTPTQLYCIDEAQAFFDTFYFGKPIPNYLLLSYQEKFNTLIENEMLHYYKTRYQTISS